MSRKKERRILWAPQPKQKIFQQRPEYEALYGGAAGGGKSDALLTEALRQVHIPHYRGIIFRKTFPQLSELEDRSFDLYAKAIPGAQFSASAHCWVFPSGAKIYFGSMQHPKDRHNYQGRSYDYIAFDELTHFTWEEYSYMFSRNRPAGPGTRVYIRSATNPGGIGHSWVKERFITPAPPMTPILEEFRIPNPKGGVEQGVRSRIFIPSTVFDNKKLLEHDKNYLATLSLLPEAEKQALLYGSWDSFDGQVFGEWKNDPAHYDDRRYTHVIRPFIIPSHWKIYRGFDFGYAKPFAVGWFAVDTQGVVYHIREYYGGTGNIGLKKHPCDIAAEIARIEREDINLRGRQIAGIADPSIFDESRGESIAAMMSRSPNFIYFSRGDNTRLAGKMQVHYRLSFDEQGYPGLYIFDHCRNFIRTLPALTYDSVHIEDVDTRGEDHIYDMLRYVLMERPISPPKPAPCALRPDDPLDLYHT